MTRRLAISMLVTVWAILIAAGVTAYLTTRSVVLANIDAGLAKRAMEVGTSGRYVVKNELGQTVGPRLKSESPEPEPSLIHAGFATLGDGERVRTASVRIWRRKDNGEFEQATVTRSESAEPFDRLMNRLAGALLLTGCAGGLIAAFVARKSARIALRPLGSTAETIGSIDERNLSRRIDATKLAPELLPVADRLNEMLARLEESFANRKQFLADASHELRTPVAALVTTLEVSLRRLREVEDYRQAMKICLSDAQLLRRLVDALMSQARGEIGAFDEEPVPVEIGAMLEECVQMLQSIAAEKAIQITRTVDGPLMLRIQLVRLRQAVMGLLENAIDHNRAGGSVEVSARVLDGAVRISIRDTGPGIAPEHLERIFEPFYRASKTREISGHMGLGLYLVKSHIEAIGGSCSVRSELGAGSTFQIVLPLSKLLERRMEAAVVS